jgi:hypothetical protein
MDKMLTLPSQTFDKVITSEFQSSYNSQFVPNKIESPYKGTRRDFTSKNFNASIVSQNNVSDHPLSISGRPEFSLRSDDSMFILLNFFKSQI